MALAKSPPYLFVMLAQNSSRLVAPDSINTASTLQGSFESGWLGLTSLLAVILAVNFGIYLLDPSPKFMLGDSASYLATALTRWIPEDRSFTYGFLLRLLAVRTHSLMPVVLFQTAIGSIAAWILSFCLIRYFRVRFWVAGLWGLACTIEPLQLISNRFVLTEAVSTFLFALYVAGALQYIKSGRLVVLSLLQILSILMISIRMSFLPLMLASSVLLPILGPAAQVLWRMLWERLTRKTSIKLDRERSALRLIGTHLLVVVLLSQLCLYGYRRWNGALTHRAPLYLHDNGLFLMAFWTPIIQRDDFPVPALRGAIFDGLKFDLRDRTLRNAECFAPDGVVRRLVAAADKRYDASVLAKKTALNAAMRDPAGLIKLSAVTWLDFFNTRYLTSNEESDEGLNHPIDQAFTDEVLTHFNQRYDGSHLHTLTQRWHHAATAWYQFLAVAPIVLLLLAILANREYLFEWIYMGLGVWLFTAQAIVLSAGPCARHLTADAWLVILMLGAMTSNFGKRRLRPR